MTFEGTSPRLRVSRLIPRNQDPCSLRPPLYIVISRWKTELISTEATQKEPDYFTQYLSRQSISSSGGLRSVQVQAVPQHDSSWVLHTILPAPKLGHTGKKHQKSPAPLLSVMPSNLNHRTSKMERPSAFLLKWGFKNSEKLQVRALPYKSMSVDNCSSMANKVPVTSLKRTACEQREDKSVTLSSNPIPHTIAEQLSVKQSPKEGN